MCRSSVTGIPIPRLRATTQRKQLHSKKGDFCITTAFRSYGKRKSQYANEYSHTAALYIAATFSIVFRRQKLLRVF